MKKIIVDILMGITIILEFASLPILIHEILGIGLIFLIVLHIKYNKRYFKAIFKGKYNLKRTIDLIINIGLLISLAITIISGICSSQKSLKNITIGGHKISYIHKSSSIFSIIFLGLHLLTTRKKLFREIKKLQWFLVFNNSSQWFRHDKKGNLYNFKFFFLENSVKKVINHD